MKQLLTDWNWLVNRLKLLLWPCAVIPPHLKMNLMSSSQMFIMNEHIHAAVLIAVKPLTLETSVKNLNKKNSHLSETKWTTAIRYDSWWYKSCHILNDQNLSVPGANYVPWIPVKVPGGLNGPFMHNSAKHIQGKGYQLCGSTY